MKLVLNEPYSGRPLWVLRCDFRDFEGSRLGCFLFKGLVGASNGLFCSQQGIAALTHAARRSHRESFFGPAQSPGGWATGVEAFEGDELAFFCSMDNAGACFVLLPRREHVLANGGAIRAGACLWPYCSKSRSA